MEGLTEEKAGLLLEKYGRNELPEKKVSFVRKLLSWFISPISGMLILAAGLSFGTGKDFDGYFIIFLILINAAITLFQEHKADTAVAALKAHFTTDVSVRRDGKWVMRPAALLVPGDLVALSVGNIVPADLTLVEASNITLNEAALTGESLPQSKHNGDILYSGAYILTGKAEGVVDKTGAETYFGRTLSLAGHGHVRSVLEKDILRMSVFLSVLSLCAVVILSVVLWLARAPLTEIVVLDLSLVIAGIPISLPTVMTLIISFGVVKLAQKQAVVRRLSSLEDLANVNLLLSDKTGTLTKNIIAVARIVPYGMTEVELLRFALLSTEEGPTDVIDAALRAKALELGVTTDGYIQRMVVPADSVRKRTTTVVGHGDTTITISVGAPQVIDGFISGVLRSQFSSDVTAAAEEGYRAIAVAYGTDGEGPGKMTLAGLLLLSDGIREDTKDVVDFLGAQSVSIEMVTGDNHAIAERVGREVGIPSERIHAEVLPADKLKLVQSAMRGGYITAVTGDGVNDLPALKAAHVGIAVANAVDALKSAADIVLLSSGLTVIMDAIVESRKIFVRLWTYSIYRISESFRVIVTIAILGLIYHTYPLQPVQLILLALLNDVPIIALAYDRVEVPARPAHIDAKKRIVRSTLFGFVGVMNSLLLFWFLQNVAHMDWDTIQSMFFLKLTVSGHLLIYLAHTDRPWWKFLPSKQVIWATTVTQLVATLFAGFGFFMYPVPWVWVLFVWGWSIAWMQIGELTKRIGRLEQVPPASMDAMTSHV